MSQLLPKLSFLERAICDKAMAVDEVHLPDALPFKASRFWVYPGQSSPVDIHSVKECWFIAQGKGELLYDGHLKVEVSPGEVLYYDAGKSHTIRNRGTQDLLIFSIWWA